MKNIILNETDVPSKEDLLQASERLKKCFAILSTTRGKKDKEDPKALKAVAGFLEALSKNK